MSSVAIRLVDGRGEGRRLLKAFEIVAPSLHREPKVILGEVRIVRGHDQVLLIPERRVRLREWDSNERPSLLWRRKHATQDWRREATRDAAWVGIPCAHRQWLGLEDVARGAGDPAGAQRLTERGLVDGSATTD